MDALRDFIDRLTSDKLPAGAMGVAAIVLFLVAFKITRGFRKVVCVVIAAALFAGAAGWYLHKN